MGMTAGNVDKFFFDGVKEKLSFPSVMPINYSIIPLCIIIAVDVSGQGWGAVIVSVGQRDTNLAFESTALPQSLKGLW